MKTSKKLLPTLDIGSHSNAGHQARREAGAQRRLDAVAFRVKAPVARRPPHRSGREGFPHPVPREPKAAVNGEPNRRLPVWRITLLSLALRDAVNDPGFG